MCKTILGERGWAGMMASSVKNVPFLPILNCVGKACRCTVHCRARLQEVWGLLNGPAEMPCIRPSPRWQWDGEAIAGSWRTCQSGAGPCRQMKNERGSPIPDLSPAVGLTQLHNGEKMPLTHDNKINVFIRKSPDGKRQHPRGITKKERDDWSRSTLAGLASSSTQPFYSL